MALKKCEGSSKTQTGSSSLPLHTTLDHLARSCLSAVPKVDSASMASALNMCTSLSDEAIQGIVAGFESAEQVEVSPEEHTSHVSVKSNTLCESCQQLI